MAGEYRESTWRQGAIFRYQDAVGIKQLGVIATHDCDICADLELEPVVEYVPVRLITALNGSMTLGKNARRLHVEIFDDQKQKQMVALDVRERVSIPKNDFVRQNEPYEYQLTSQDVVVFRRWLSARYSRSAFANAFEVQMDRVREPIDRLAKTHGRHIRALYFDVDDNQLVERRGTDEPYALSIYVVYPSDTNDAEAGDFAVRLKQIFAKAFCHQATNEWAGIQLTSCDAVSEDTFPLSLALSSKPWRVDHRSYRDQSDGNLYPDHGG